MGNYVRIYTRHWKKLSGNHIGYVHTLSRHFLNKENRSQMSFLIFQFILKTGTPASAAFFHFLFFTSRIFMTLLVVINNYRNNYNNN